MGKQFARMSDAHDKHSDHLHYTRSSSSKWTQIFDHLCALACVTAPRTEVFTPTTREMLNAIYADREFTGYYGRSNRERYGNVIVDNAKRAVENGENWVAAAESTAWAEASAGYQCDGGIPC